jgi:hypothetical protein
MKLSLPLILFLALFGGAVKAVFGWKHLRRVVEMLACGAIGGSFPCALSLFAACREPVKDRSPSSQSMNGERWYL